MVFSAIFSRRVLIWEKAATIVDSNSALFSLIVCCNMAMFPSTVFFPLNVHLKSDANLSNARSNLLISTTSDAMLAPTVVNAALWASSFVVKAESSDLSLSCWSTNASIDAESSKLVPCNFIKTFSKACFQISGSDGLGPTASSPGGAATMVSSTVPSGNVLSG